MRTMSRDTRELCPELRHLRARPAQKPSAARRRAFLLTDLLTPAVPGERQQTVPVIPGNRRVVSPDKVRDQRRDRVRVHRVTPDRGEHIAALAPLRPHSLAVGRLAITVLAEHLDGPGVDADGPGPAALGRPLDALAADYRRRAGDADLSGAQVHIAPAKIQQLPAACPRVSSQMEEREKPVAFRGAQEGSKLPRRPDA